MRDTQKQMPLFFAFMWLNSEEDILCEHNVMSTMDKYVTTMNEVLAMKAAE